MTNLQDLHDGTPVREPAINLPWPVGALIFALAVAHFARVLTGVDGGVLAMASTDLTRGNYGSLITYQFVHGGWAHLLMNAAFILAFGAPVARLFGGGVRGGAVFLSFFLGCGVIAALGFAAADALAAAAGAATGPWALMGASGAAAGLMGGAVRLVQGGGRLGAVFGRSVWLMTGGWIAANLILGLSGMTPGAGDTPVAWQAHIFGYFAGLLLIGPFARLARGGIDHENAL